MTITYPVKHGIYVNMTNRCPCACTFCLRQSGPKVYGSDPLWLEREPTVQEVCDDLEKQDLSQYQEVVFCGYGEPTRAAGGSAGGGPVSEGHHPNLPLRINTNGLSDLIWQKPTAPMLKGLIDTVSISLNAMDAQEYLRLHPEQIRHWLLRCHAEVCQGVHPVCAPCGDDGGG